MTKVSASTLARQAAKTTDRAEAKMLRAKAAKLRREARSARVAKMPHSPALESKRRAERSARAPDPVLEDYARAVQKAETQHRIELNEALFGDGHTMRVAGVGCAPFANAPGHGEIVGGYMASMAKTLAELARKKGGVDAIQGRLMTLEHQTRHDEKVYAREREKKAVQAAREEMRDKIVCGFLASFDTAEATGTQPAVWGLNSFTTANIVNALKANGYTAVGKR